MRCLILGGSGFIGSHLCDELVAHGHSVKAFDRSTPNELLAPASYDQIDWFKGDFSDSDALKKALSGCDVVFHLISTTLPKNSNDNPIFDVESNLVSTLRLLDLIKDSNVKKVIFLSSGGTVYGIPETIPISETHPANPICSYGITKLCIEKYLHLYHKLYGLDYAILRISNPFGERQRFTASQGVTAVFLHRAIHKQPVEIWGNGEIIRDYIYIKDVTKAIMAAMEYQGTKQLFNIGSGVGKSINTIISDIESLLGYEISKNYLPARNFDIDVNILDNSLAIEELQWSPTTRFRDGLALTLAWMQKIGDKKY